MGPFSVSSNGASVRSALGPQSLLAFNKPMTKLDTTNTVSFQTLNILFNHEPPQPTAATPSADTLVYSFPHGYQYVPSIWMEWRNPSPSYPVGNPAPGLQTTTFPEFGDETAAENITGVGTATQLSLLADTKYNDPVSGIIAYFSDAFLYAKVISDTVYLYVRKQVLQLDAGGNAVPVYIIGTTINMRIYVFTEPATTSTY